MKRIHNMSTLTVVIQVMAIVFAASGCTEDDQFFSKKNQTHPDTLTSQDNPLVEQSSDEDESIHHEERSTPPAFTFNLPTDQFIANDGTLTIKINNVRGYDAAGTLTIYRSSPEAHGLLEPVSVLIKAQQTTTLILPVDTLKLPTMSQDYPGSLRMHVEAHLEEGGRETSIAPTLFFHPVEGGWTFYNDAILKERFHNGLLTEAAQRLAAEGAQATPPDPHFSPPIDGEEEEVPPTIFHTSSPSEKVNDSPYALPGVDF